MLLLDTNIVSYLTDRSPLSELYRSILQGTILLISFMTKAEMLEGVYRVKEETHKVRKILRELEKYEVLPFDERTCDIWAKIRTERRNKPISVADAWVAATAIAYDLPLVTHNARDFDGIERLNIMTEYR